MERQLIGRAWSFNFIWLLPIFPLFPFFPFLTPFFRWLNRYPPACGMLQKIRKFDTENA
jgi:hypothetical protein